MKLRRSITNTSETKKVYNKLVSAVSSDLSPRLNIWMTLAAMNPRPASNIPIPIPAMAPATIGGYVIGVNVWR